MKQVSKMVSFVRKSLVLSDSTLKNKSTWHPGGVSGTRVRRRSTVALVPRNNFGFLKTAASPERSTSKSFIKLVQRSHKSARTASHVQEECQKKYDLFFSSSLLQTPPWLCFFFFPHLTWPPDFSTLKHVSDAGAWRWQHGQQVSQQVWVHFYHRAVFHCLIQQVVLKLNFNCCLWVPLGRN